MRKGSVVLCCLVGASCMFSAMAFDKSKAIDVGSHLDPRYATYEKGDPSKFTSAATNQEQKDALMKMKDRGSSVAKELVEELDPDTEHDDIFQMSAENYARYLNGDKVTLVFFYVPWNGMCKKVMPEFVGFAAKLKEDIIWHTKIQAGKVNCDKYPGLCDKFEIAGYPQLKIFPREYDRMKLDRVQVMEGGRFTDTFLRNTIDNVERDYEFGRTPEMDQLTKDFMRWSPKKRRNAIQKQDDEDGEPKGAIWQQIDKYIENNEFESIQKAMLYKNQMEVLVSKGNNQGFKELSRAKKQMDNIIEYRQYGVEDALNYYMVQNIVSFFLGELNDM